MQVGEGRKREGGKEGTIVCKILKRAHTRWEYTRLPISNEMHIAKAERFIDVSVGLDTLYVFQNYLGSKHTLTFIKPRPLDLNIYMYVCTYIWEGKSHL